MKWLKKKLRSWVLEANEYDTSDMADKPGRLVASRDVEPVLENDPILNFRVFSAVGGRVVEFRIYDRQKDRHNTQTYIITKDEDFGEKIAKIATLESMKT
jgi:hypothetical protein